MVTHVKHLAQFVRRKVSYHHHHHYSSLSLQDPQEPEQVPSKSRRSIASLLEVLPGGWGRRELVMSSCVTLGKSSALSGPPSPSCSCADMQAGRPSSEAQ